MKFIRLITISMFLVCNFSYALSAETDEIESTLLERHNYYRGIAGIPLMKWNDGLATLAQKWANTLKKNGCKMKHSSHSFRKNVAGFSYIGENLYWRGSSAPFAMSADYAQNGVDNWYTEIRDFQYSEKGVICPLRGKKGAIGHFTQVMWDKSIELGCAYAQCSGGKSMVLVCHYGPGGNFNMRSTPPFDASAAARLNAHEINKQFGGLPTCR